MAGIWKALSHPPPFYARTMLLLTDGTVMCQEEGGIGWWQITPDIYGNYLEGSWSRLAPMLYSRLFYASVVLADGRVFIAGGEHSSAGSNTNTGEIYHTHLDLWTDLSSPGGWARISDAPCCVLPSSEVFLGNIDDQRTALYRPSEPSWRAGERKDDSNSKESRALLSDGSVLARRMHEPPAPKRYVPTLNIWASAAMLPVGVDLVEAESIEVGPMLLMRDGRAPAIGVIATASHRRRRRSKLPERVRQARSR